MSRFTVPVVRVDAIEVIEGADRIEAARVLGYRIVVPKGAYRPGDLAVYIPEASVVPENVLVDLGLVGKLAGPQHNRVKAMRLRGVVSQGLLYRPPFVIALGEDLAEKLAIGKYEPPIPEHMTGEVVGLHGKTISYDIEEILKYPGVLRAGESVVITEKLHGTFCGLVQWPNLRHPDLIDGEFYSFSKGLGARGLVFKACAANARNLYQTALEEARHLGVFQHLRAQFRPPAPIFVLGEVFGKGVQDISYAQARPAFAAFDIYIGEPGHGRFLDEDEFAIAYPFPRVPVLFKGQFSDVVLANHRDGASVMGGDRAREGIVVKSMPERNHPELGRVILKAVSATHLFRKGDQTEYQ